MKYIYITLIAIALLFTACGKSDKQNTTKQLAKMETTENQNTVFGEWAQININDYTLRINIFEDSISIIKVGRYDVEDMFSGKYRIADSSIHKGEPGGPMPEDEENWIYIEAELTSANTNTKYVEPIKYCIQKDGLMLFCFLKMGYDDEGSQLGTYYDSCITCYKVEENATYPIDKEIDNWVLPIAREVMHYYKTPYCSYDYLFPDYIEDETIKTVCSDDHTFYSVYDTQLKTTFQVKVFKTGTNTNIVAITNFVDRDGITGNISFFEVNLSKHTVQEINRPIEPRDYGVRVTDIAYILQPDSKDIIVKFADRKTTDTLQWDGSKFVAQQ